MLALDLKIGLITEIGLISGWPYNRRRLYQLQNKEKAELNRAIKDMVPETIPVTSVPYGASVRASLRIEQFKTHRIKKNSQISELHKAYLRVHNEDVW